MRRRARSASSTTSTPRARRRRPPPRRFTRPEREPKLDKQLGDLVQVELELTIEKNPSIRESQVAEATVFTKGHPLRARAATSDMRASIDGLTDKLVREVRAYHEKRRREPRRRVDHNSA